MLLAEWKTVAFIVSIVDPSGLNRIKFEFHLALLGNCERQLILAPATFSHRIGKLRYRDGLGKACGCAISVSQRFYVLLVIASNHDHREIFPTHVNRTEQGHAMWTVVEINDGKIEMSTQPADQLQRVAGIISKMTDTAIFD